MNTSVITYRPGYNHSLEIIMTTAQFVEVKSANVNGIFEIVSNKGIAWQVRDPVDPDGTFLVQKRQVVRGPWTEDDQDDAPAPAPLLTQALAQVTKAAEPKPAKAPKEATGEPVVTLKELCFDLDIVPRIARRKLRKALGQVGTGHRWEWPLGSQDLEKVKQVLLAKPAPTDDSDDSDDADE